MSRKPFTKQQVIDEGTSALELILSSIPEGRATALIYARQLSFSDDRYRDFIKAYETNKKQDLGHLCREHGIPPQDFLADINRAAYPIIEESAKLAFGIARGIVTKRLPKVVERGLIEASKADGVTDRHFHLQNEGFHPVPKAASISMTQVNQQAAGLTSFEDETRELASILGDEIETPLLESGAETDYIDAEEVSREGQLA